MSAPAAAPTTLEVPAHCQMFLAFDFGLKRTGVATGNRITRSATPQATINAEGDARFPLIAQRLKEWQPDALVVGVPFHPDGAAHDNTRRAKAFARQLHGRFRLPVHEVDGRSTTPVALPADAAVVIIDSRIARGLVDRGLYGHPSNSQSAGAVRPCCMRHHDARQTSHCRRGSAAGRSRARHRSCARRGGRGTRGTGTGCPGAAGPGRTESAGGGQAQARGALPARRSTAWLSSCHSRRGRAVPETPRHEFPTTCAGRR